MCLSYQTLVWIIRNINRFFFLSRNFRFFHFVIDNRRIYFNLRTRNFYFHNFLYDIFLTIIFWFHFLGATNVGSVQIYIDEQLKTNRWLGIKPGKDKYTNYDELKLSKEIQLNKGELLGQFNMGSTVVMIFEAPTNFKFNLKTGQTIQLGEPIGNLAEIYKESLI